MKRTLNYTGRKTIYHEDASITLQPKPGGGCEFDVRLDLAEYKLPDHALVYVEAYRQTTWMRFPWGSVGKLQSPAVRLLSEFESPDDILFRVKVVCDDPHGQLVAEADQIRPCDPGEDNSNRLPLLPVKPEDLGEEMWKVEIEAPTTRLLVNSSFGDVHAIALSPQFRALVYPAALRTILKQALCDRGTDGQLPSEGESDEWQSKWIRFCQYLPGIASGVDPYDFDDLDEREEWIDEAVRAFCRRQKLKELLPELGVGGQNS
jgi:hypothetical protein